MKNISDIFKNIEISSQKTPEINFSEKDAEIINNLFFSLQGIFPAFRQAWGSDALFEKAKTEWIKAFALAGINSIEKINVGLNKCRLLKTPWIPTPGQFIGMCMPEVSLVPPIYIGLPKPIVTPEIQNSEMLKMRQQLGIKCKTPSKPSQHSKEFT